jgi:heme exporter protein A
VLEAADLECERGGRTLFRALSFALQPGERLRVAGANGSGKTSLLRILCGLLAPTQGRVTWNGGDIASLREEYSTRIVYLGHAPAVKDELTAAENLAITCRLAGNPQLQAAIGAALGKFGLADKPVPVKKMSQGQRRRAALARLALSAGQPLWLLDEPFSALDAAGIAILNASVEDHTARGGMVVFTTHQDAGIAGARVIELG